MNSPLRRLASRRRLLLVEIGLSRLDTARAIRGARAWMGLAGLALVAGRLMPWRTGRVALMIASAALALRAWWAPPPRR